MSKGTLSRRALPVTAWGFTGFGRGSDGGGSRFRRTLLAVTGSESSSRATAVVAQMACDHGTEVYLIHFCERVSLGRGCYWDLETVKDAHELVAGVRDALGRRGVRGEILTYNSWANMTPRLIAEAAEQINADLIVIGRARGRSSLCATLRGPVAHDILTSQ